MRMMVCFQQIFVDYLVDFPRLISDLRRKKKKNPSLCPVIGLVGLSNPKISGPIYLLHLSLSISIWMPRGPRGDTHLDKLLLLAERVAFLLWNVSL